MMSGLVATDAYPHDVKHVLLVVAVVMVRLWLARALARRAGAWTDEVATTERILNSLGGSMQEQIPLAVTRGPVPIPEAALPVQGVDARLRSLLGFVLRIGPRLFVRGLPFL